ncbi:hypothetical protein DFS34DRAFT_631683 [Phlyctochytrium arcticum]|nr:hypothetical protein DFS34DRAFT_631683 [Phlyctochytrium arcticum]
MAETHSSVADATLIPLSPASSTWSTSPDAPAIPLDVGDVAGVQGRIRFKHDAGDQEHTRDASWLDAERQQLQAYEYLCHIAEAKEWIEACTKLQIVPISELEEDMRNGIVLAHLAKSFEPTCVKRIFEDRTRLQFRHSDNINFLFEAMRRVGLPDVFFFELTDLYDKKNIPKVIYCIHALSHLLSKRGLAPSMKNLVGQLSFTEEQLDATQQSLEEAGVTMPAFKSVGDALSKELAEPEAAPVAPPEPVETEEQKRHKELAQHSDQVVKLQAEFRGYMARKRYQETLTKYRAQQAALEEKRQKEYLESVVRAQSAIRMHLQRKRYMEKQKRFADNEKSIMRLQAAWKGRKARQNYKKRVSDIHGKEVAWTKLQARFKGRKQRRHYLERANYLNAQADSVTKIQAMWRAKRFAKAYKTLSNVNNPSTKVLRNFMDLLEDNENDFEEDTEVERLRQQVVKRIRENITLEAEVADLDTKISLLVRNRISLDEVIHFTSKKMRMTLSQNQLNEKSSSTVNLRAKDRESTSRRKHYEELFYLLQTQPQYLAKLVFSMNKMTGASATKFLTKVVLSLYGYAQDRRVESLLLSLFKEAIKLEVDDISSLEEFWRADPFFIRLVVDYTRRGSNAYYLRSLVEPLVKNVLADKDLNLETDALAIYRSLIVQEESKTGEKSSRPYDASPKQAMEDPEVNQIQTARIAKIKELTNQYLEAIVQSVKSMPFGLRCLARQLRETLQRRFPGNDDEIIRLVGGNFIYYRYISPAIIQPEQFEVIDMSVAGSLTPIQRKNLAEIAKMLHQMSVGKPFSNQDDQNHRDLNEYISEMFKNFMAFFKEASTVDAEVEDEYAEAMNEYASMAQKSRPTVKLTPGEIFHLHQVLMEHIQDVAPDEKDNIRQVLKDLEPVPPQQEEGGFEIELRLRNRFPSLEDERAARVRALWNDAKRYTIAVVRIQSGRNLLDILEAPVTEAEEASYQEYLEQEEQQAHLKRGLQDRTAMTASKENLGGSGSVQGSTNALSGGGEKGSDPQLARASVTMSVVRLDGAGSGMTFFALKRRALEIMARLEAEGEVSKSNQYQDMLNSIAKDMLTKSRRRSRRRKELESLRNTLKNLEEKAVYLDDQKKSYHDYISTCMAQLRTKQHKGKRPLPFTRQYAHQRALQKSGKVPKFGSYKYTAAELYKKGVLLSIDDVSSSRYGQVTLTISSDEAGVFLVEAAFFGVTMKEKCELQLEDLLAAQYNNETVMTLMEGAKVNLNLLIFLLNKKFYV